MNLKELPKDIQEIILNYTYQMEHTKKFKKCLNEIKDENTFNNIYEKMVERYEGILCEYESFIFFNRYTENILSKGTLINFVERKWNWYFLDENIFNLQRESIIKYLEDNSGFE